MLKIGIEIFYTGDTANLPGQGKIVAVHLADKFQPDRYDIQMDDGRFFRSIWDIMFSPQPGRRFKLLREEHTEREQAKNRFLKRFTNGAL